jgi:hypothetical protein
MSLTTDELLQLPLYVPKGIGSEDAATMKRLFVGRLNLDSFCMDCGSPSIFIRGFTKNDANAIMYIEDDEVTVTLRCSRNTNHTIQMWFIIRNLSITKVGQTPSIADLSTPELNDYKKLLGPDRVKELKKATGLISHGVGIGAYAYLRRVFESILRDHRNRLEVDGPKIGGFDGLRMDQKIDALQATLPPFLVQNQILYGILSKGLHELTEDDCLLFFPSVYKATLMILRQDEEQRRRVEEEKEAAVELQKISSRLGAKKQPAG